MDKTNISNVCKQKVNKFKMQRPFEHKDKIDEEYLYQNWEEVIKEYDYFVTKDINLST